MGKELEVGGWGWERGGVGDQGMLRGRGGFLQTWWWGRGRGR